MPPHELHFAMALMPETRGMQDAGWNTALEASQAYDEFNEHVTNLGREKPVRVRIILAFYLHVAEAAGLYEIPKMLLTVEGRGNNVTPFEPLVNKHRQIGNAIAPNANVIMKDLMGHALELGFSKLSEVFNEAFDADVRNAIAHSDYILLQTG